MKKLGLGFWIVLAFAACWMIYAEVKIDNFVPLAYALGIITVSLIVKLRNVMKKDLKIFHFNRPIYDHSNPINELIECVIVAQNKNQAIDLANKISGNEGPVWSFSNQVIHNQIGIYTGKNRNSHVVMTRFKNS